MEISPAAGKPADPSILTNIPRLITAYFTQQPDVSVSAQKVSFGTSGHRGSSLTNSFNEWHILAITQAICMYRKQNKIEGPLFLGIDTHALSEPAAVTTLEVLAGNEVEVMIAANNEYTPTPAVSQAILTYNKGRTEGLADGIVITPSHNPPDDGGFKYNATHGGPAGTEITSWVEKTANEILENKLKAVIRMRYEKALRVSTTHRFDYINHYVDDLKNVINLDILRDSKINIGADPLGGAGVHYWGPIAEKYKLNLHVVSDIVDPTFRFMSVDWDGKIRMDPSSSYAMQRLIGMKDKYDISVACDTDHDRHSVVTKSVGLVPPNHYLTACIFYLLQNRPAWKKDIAIGKTLVSSRMIDRVTKKLGHPLYEVPVGFKWFVDGLLDGSLGFVGEESAGASFCRKNGEVWTTDKDGFIPALLAAEMTATLGRDPGEIYKSLADELGHSTYDRVEAPANPEQKAKLSKLNPDDIKQKTMAGEPITAVLTKAPGNGAPIGGLKLETENGWIAARPSGTENIYKIYAESFKNEEHLEHILEEAQGMVDSVLGN
jgi:phosphoglucomutase